MRSILIIVTLILCVYFVIGCSVAYKVNLSDGDLVTKIKLKKKVFKPGECTAPEVRLINACGKNIYLVGHMPEDYAGSRLPFCYFERINLDGSNAKCKDCIGWISYPPVCNRDIKVVKNGESFNPFGKDYFPAITSSAPVEPGKYKIRFVYATKLNEKNLPNPWIFSVQGVLQGQDNYRYFWPVYDRDTADMLKKVPKIIVYSNWVEFEVRNIE